MKLFTIAIGAGLGYLAGNEQARTKTFDAVKQLTSTPQAKSIEGKVSSKVTDLSSKAAAKAKRKVDVTDDTIVGAADAVDTSAQRSSQDSKTTKAGRSSTG